MNRCQKLGAMLALGCLLTLQAKAQPVLNAVPAMGGTAARWGHAMVWVDELGGEHRVSAWLDLARTVVRRAERHALSAALAPSSIGPYLNRLSDLLWTLARWQEGTSRFARGTDPTR